MRNHLIRSFAPLALLTLVPVAPAALVGYWDFNEGSGQLVADSSGSGNHGTLGASAAADSDDPAWVTGHTGNVGDFALSFDNDNDVVIVPDPGSSSLDIGGSGSNDAFSASVWINRAGNTNDVIFIKGPSNATNQNNLGGNYELIVLSNGQLSFIWERESQQDGVQSRGDSATGVIGTGEWLHIGVIVQESPSGVEVKLFLNGSELDVTHTGANNPFFGKLNDEPFRIGDRKDGNPTFGGAIDDLAIWNNALHPLEIGLLASGEDSPLSIPEPASATLLAIAAVLTARRRRGIRAG